MAVAALFGLSYCAKDRTGDPAPVTAPASAPGAGASGAIGGWGPGPSSAPASAPAIGASVPGGDVQSSTEPEGSGILAWLSSEAPALKVYFETGKTDVSAEFGAKATELVNYLKANADAKAVISGFNDPTGDPAKNAELSKQRAEAVQAALVAAGVPQERTVLEKPAEPTATASTNSAARRVEVVVRK